MLIILSGKALTIAGGIFQRKPASTMRSGRIDSRISRRNLSSLNAFRLKKRAATSRALQRSITAASRLFVSTATTFAVPLFWKYRMMFSALVPEPEANRTIRFMALLAYGSGRSPLMRAINPILRLDLSSKNTTPEHYLLILRDILSTKGGINPKFFIFANNLNLKPI